MKSDGERRSTPDERLTPLAASRTFYPMRQAESSSELDHRLNEAKDLLIGIVMRGHIGS